MMHQAPMFSDKEMKTRIGILRDELEAIDSTIIFNRPDLYYYSQIGLDGIIHINDDVTRYVQRNVELARELSSIEVQEMKSFRVFKEIAKQTSPETLGLELDIIPYKTIKYVEKAFNHPKIVDISPILRQIRSVKSQEEQKVMKQAAKQTDNSFEFIQEHIKPGATEVELSAKIESFLRNNGHPGIVNIRKFQHNFTTLSYVMSGESTGSLNTLFGPTSGIGLNRMHMNGPSLRKIKNDEAVLIDTTGVIGGYTADETQTFFIGHPDKKLLEAYEAAKEVHNLAEKLLVVGNYVPDVYSKMIELITELGFSKNFMGLDQNKVAFIGHGIGLELDEFPLITLGYPKKLIKGQIIALEPKFIFDKPSSGVGLELDYIVGAGKAERITHFGNY